MDLYCDRIIDFVKLNTNKNLDSSYNLNIDQICLKFNDEDNICDFLECVGIYDKKFKDLLSLIDICLSKRILTYDKIKEIYSSNWT